MVKMMYKGGKSMIAKDIAVELVKNGFENYYEPFLGSAAVAVAISELVDVPMFLSDNHPDLILMWNDLKQGWIPPDFVSKEEHHQLKYEEPSALRGFVGFGMSFGGDFYHGYAQNKRGTDYCGE